MNHKTARQDQQYESYWKLTLEYTDFCSDSFNKTLNLIVEYIDSYDGVIDSTIYKNLQEELNSITPKRDLASIRKAINQFLKLGFINNKMMSYHPKTKEFLKQEDSSRKKAIYSEILYDNASFNRSFSNSTDVNEINFLVKTLEYCGSLSKDNLLAIMFINPEDYPKGFLSLDELEDKTKYIQLINAEDRKYNQRNYLFNLCKNSIIGVYVNRFNCLTLEADVQVSEVIRNSTTTGRDPYKHRLYKKNLELESVDKLHKVACCVENLDYPTLIASHIKPYRLCNEEERFDPENGLLLSRNMDALFDTGWITFSDQGQVICSSDLSAEVIESLSSKFINSDIINSPKRLAYMEFHRNYIFRDVSKNNDLQNK